MIVAILSAIDFLVLFPSHPDYQFDAKTSDRDKMEEKISRAD